MTNPHTYFLTRAKHAILSRWINDACAVSFDPVAELKVERGAAQAALTLEFELGFYPRGQ